MALVGVVAVEESARTRASALAVELGVTLLDAEAVKAARAGVVLFVNTINLALGFADSSRGRPYIVDFLSNSWRLRWQQGLARGHIFRRALGGVDDPLHVVDATAGLGQDSALMLSLGCRVTAVERAKVLTLLLQDAGERVSREDAGVAAKLKKLQVVNADAVTYLQGLQGGARPQVVYMDPMFKKPKSKAKSPKEMQLLQELFGDVANYAEEEERLFQAAFATATERVVVKRPLKARALSRAPSHSFKGQSIRYDVYLVSP